MFNDKNNIMKTSIDIFNIDTQKHIATVKRSEIDRYISKYRKIGYSVMVDQDGDICIDRSGDDNGLTYKNMMDELAQ